MKNSQGECFLSFANATKSCKASHIVERKSNNLPDISQNIFQTVGFQEYLLAVFHNSPP